MLFLTQGDPASIAPEITIKAWRHFHQSGPVFVYVGDPQLIEPHIKCTPVSFDTPHAAIAETFSKTLPVIPLTCLKKPIPGHPNIRNGKTIIQSIKRCTDMALLNKKCAIVTNPISKEIVQKAGLKHPGHTSFLAELCGMDGEEVMAMACPGLMTVPVTTHLSLRQAIENLTPQLIIKTARIIFHELKTSFGCEHPRLVCTGLNPHAGENGLLGHEEETIIEPALQQLRHENIIVEGPFAADTLFIEEKRKNYDAALCMYHDQALIPVKTLNIHQGVNITLGLPIIRTSPDHGTGFDIAGKNIANPKSLEYALTMATKIIHNRKRFNVE